MAKRKEPEVKKGLDEWMGTYGDMVTLLLCFFVLLFSMATIDAAKFAQVAASFSSVNRITIMESASSSILESLGNGIVQMPQAQGEASEDNEEKDKATEELVKMASDFKTYFAQQNLQDKIDVEQNEQYITLNFKDGILFDSGKAELKAEALGALDIVSNELAKYPENNVKIEGHADNMPINTPRYPNNWYLSAARAISVAMYFTETKGFSPERISAEGYGEFRPRVPNDTPENRSINRRVEIKILSKYQPNEDN
ncbi:MAG: flagellar motor protein MotB [Clostridiales bacterium]|jgi:chemotaxis protein MotB|nr:flagellar motor protein MotB [Clostridiales bacterium]